MNRLLKVFSWGSCYPPEMSGDVCSIQNGWLDWRTRIFGEKMKLITKNSWGLQKRDGKCMKGRHLSGTTKTIRNRIYINPVTAPPVTVWLDWRTRIFGEQMKKVSDKFWGLQDRNGKGIRWTIRPRKRVGWGICKRLNAPPKKELVDLIGYWGWQLKHCDKVINVNSTDAADRYSVFNKMRSLEKLRKKNEIESNY